MTIDLSDLRAKASVATPGPWHREMIELGPGGPMTIGVGSAGPPVCIMNGIVESPRGNRDATYVAAMSPQVTIALLDRLAAAEGERDRLKDANAALCRLCTDLPAEGIVT